MISENLINDDVKLSLQMHVEGTSLMTIRRTLTTGLCSRLDRFFGVPKDEYAVKIDDLRPVRILPGQSVAGPEATRGRRAEAHGKVSSSHAFDATICQIATVARIGDFAASYSQRYLTLKHDSLLTSGSLVRLPFRKGPGEERGCEFEVGGWVLLTCKLEASFQSLDRLGVSSLP